MHPPGSSPALGPAAAEEPLKTVRGGCLTSSGHQPSLLSISRRLVNAWPKRVRSVLTQCRLRMIYVRNCTEIYEHDWQWRIGFKIAKLGPLDTRILMHGWIFPTRGTKYPIPMTSSQRQILSMNLPSRPLTFCSRLTRLYNQIKKDLTTISR
jgi:hypothetical protein